MQLTRHTAGGHYEITSVKPGSVRIDETDYTQSLIVGPEILHADWPVRAVSDLTDERVQELLDLKPDVVLLGTGGQTRFPAQSVFAALYQRGIGLEAMTTAAACRTFNVLVSEERNVIAGLML